jgi:XTP/dITP diphosphohydrolase
MPTLLIASRNAHKAEEIGAILGDEFTILTLATFPDAPPVIEDGDSFAANATKKSHEIACWVYNNGVGHALPDYILADDSGLEVDALSGAPGIHSARYASGEKQGNATDSDNNAKLLREMADVPEADRDAQFRCVLALTPLGQALRTELFEGICRGRISQSEAGSGGFGYDPLFIPDGFAQSFAELGSATKNTLSHRAKALANLAAFF